ncbi:MAG: DUF3157 family protein [Kiloniellales bacterium]|nr:DUF3157 family protein [Kiloniellales bacterium]
MRRNAVFCFVLLVLQLFAAPSFAEGMELTAPDGRKVMLYDDFTWEYKRSAPAATGDTVNVDDLVAKPSNFVGEELVVTGKILKFLGDYRINSTKDQNNIVVDLESVRRADQIKLDQALDKAGWSTPVKAQITGTVESGTLTHYLKAKDIVVVTQ